MDTLKKENDYHQVAHALNNLDPHFLPEEIFYAISRLVVTVTIELVPYVQKEGGTYLLLLKRPSSDPFWPSLLHTPGTVARPTDPTLPQTQLERIFKDELTMEPYLSSVAFCSTAFFSHKRGTSFSLVFTAPLPHAPIGELYPIDQLPYDNMVQEQLPFIKEALKHIP